MLWVYNGDLNTNFFHTCARANRYKNSIFSITDSSGLVYTDRNNIESIFLNHFSGVWTKSDHSSFSSLLDLLPTDLPKISSAYCILLTRPVTKNEIHSTLMSLPNGKSLGLDGFNMEFYKFFGMI